MEFLNHFTRKNEAQRRISIRFFSSTHAIYVNIPIFLIKIPFLKYDCPDLIDCFAKSRSIMNFEDEIWTILYGTSELEVLVTVWSFCHQFDSYSMSHILSLPSLPYFLLDKMRNCIKLVAWKPTWCCWASIAACTV